MCMCVLSGPYVYPDRSGKITMSQATPSPQSSTFTQWMQARLGRRGAFWIGGSVITLGIVLFVWFLFQPSGAAGSPGVLAVSQQAPNFSLVNTAGKQVSLSQFQGHPVLVNFWSTTC